MSQGGTIKPQRLQYFDLLKGIAIFLVVMGHVITMCIRDIDSAFIFKVVKEVHMPLFFFISGYLTYKSRENFNFVRPDLWKRFKQLIIPFIIMSALWIWYFPHSHLGSPISDNLMGMYNSYWKDGYWFTLCLFEIFVIYYPLSIILSKIKNAMAQIVTTTIVYIALIFLANQVSSEATNSDIIGAGLLASFFPVFMIGVFSRRYADTFKRIVDNNICTLIAFMALIASWYYLVYIWEFPNIPAWVQFIARPIEHLSLVIIATLVITPWSNKEYNTPGNTPSPLAHYFTFLGKESLSIYLIHYFFLFPLTPLQEPMRALSLSFVPLVVVAICVSFIVIAITLLVNYIIQRNSILSFLLIGKEK